MRRCNQEYDLRTLTVANHCSNNRTGIHRFLSCRSQDIHDFSLFKRRFPLLEYHRSVFLFVPAQLHQHSVLYDLIAQNRIRNIIPGIQRCLIRFPELEIKRTNQHARLRIHDLQPNIGNILWINPFEIILGPSLSGYQIFMIEIFAHFLRKVCILIGHPLGLHSDQMIMLQKIGMESNSQTTRK